MLKRRDKSPSGAPLFTNKVEVRFFLCKKHYDEMKEFLDTYLEGSDLN